MTVPHKLVRRLAIAPLVAAIEAALILVSPVLLIVAVVAAPAFGGLRTVRMLFIVLIYAGRHLGATVACLGLWVASGFGRNVDSDTIQRAHYAVLRWFVEGVYRAVIGVARVEVQVLESARAEETIASPDRPVLVLSRHAGEGDSFLLLHQLLCLHGRRPRVVMHEALRLDPLIDVMGERLPNRFVDPRGGDTEKEIAAVAAGLESEAAVVIFPEGGNFSAGNRERGIARLERAGHEEQAARARRMTNVSAPRPGGSLAAVTAAPDADVVIVGHIGFPTSLGELWRLLPAAQTVELRMWLVPAGEVPTGFEEQIDWLYEWWGTLDTWIDERRRAAAPASAAPG